jgi:hypothetical protein
MATRYFGARTKRTEDFRLVTGRGRYTDDIGAGSSEGLQTLEAAFLRSPHAHARILDIDVSEAIELEGVIAIYTYEDLEDAAAFPLPVLIPHPALHAPRTNHALAKDVVRHVGEAIVMVVATDSRAHPLSLSMLLVRFVLFMAIPPASVGGVIKIATRRILMMKWTARTNLPMLPLMESIRTGTPTQVPKTTSYHQRAKQTHHPGEVQGPRQRQHGQWSWYANLSCWSFSFAYPI